MATGEQPKIEYVILPEEERARLVELGGEGWELVSAGGSPEARVLYLKREGLDFRERVTLDQRRRYYESLGLDPDARPGANPR